MKKTIVSKFRKRKRKSLACVHVLKKTCSAVTAKKCTKKRDARAELLFFQSKTLLTWSGGPQSSGVDFFYFVSPRA